MAKSKILTGMLKKLNNPYATIAIDGIIGGDIHGFIDSGSYILNGLVSGSLFGGFAKGKVTALAGQKGSGKTFILMKTVQRFLDTNPDNLFILFESEGAVTQDMLRERGIDMDRVMVVPVSTVEELRNQAIIVLDNFKAMAEEDRPDLLIGLDSLGMLSTEFEINTATTGDNKADMGKRAQLIKSVFRIITLRLAFMDIPMLITNHTYSTMDAYSGDKMGGGTGLEFAASNIIFLSKAGDKEKVKNIKTLVGNIITCGMHKGRLTIEGSKAQININFKTGLDEYFGLLDIAVASKLVVRTGNNYSVNGEILAKNKKEVYSNAEAIFTDELLKKLDKFVAEKYKYGSAIEDEEEVEQQTIED